MPCRHSSNHICEPICRHWVVKRVFKEFLIVSYPLEERRCAARAPLRSYSCWAPECEEWPHNHSLTNTPCT